MRVRSLVLGATLLAGVGCGEATAKSGGQPTSQPGGTVTHSGDAQLCQRIRENSPGALDDVRTGRPARSEALLTDPLVCAILGNNLDVAAELMRQGYDPNWRVPADPPVLAAFLVGDLDSSAPTRQGGQFMERRRAVLRLLLDHGLDPCQQYTAGTGAGLTAYYTAKSAGETNMAALFVAEGADCTAGVARPR